MVTATNIMQAIANGSPGKEVGGMPGFVGMKETVKMKVV